MNRLTTLLLTISILFLSGCQVPKNGDEYSYDEDGILEQIDSYENGVYKNSKELKLID